MKGATEAAKRLKSFFNSLRSKLGKVPLQPTTDPITQILLGIFSRDVPEAKAREALDQLRSLVVDYNELRVIPPLEMSRYVGEYPDVRLKCEDITRALNRIFALEHAVSLDRVKALPKKEILAYLDRVDGLDAYTRARVRLLGLGLHAIPLDEAMWHAAIEARIVDAKCEQDEAQAFLERQIPEDQALEFFTLLRKHAWNEYANAVKKRAVRPITSVPPDRTTRNMLQMLQSGNADGLPDLPLDDEIEFEELAKTEAVPADAGGRKKSGKPAKGAAPKPAKAAAPKPASAPAKRAEPAAKAKPPAKAKAEKPARRAKAKTA